jgi:hypothetical protein
MRRDTLKHGRAYSYVYNLENRELVMLDHFLKRAEVRKPQGTDNKDASAQLKLSLKASGEKRALGHWDCLAHTLVASMPVQIGPERATMHFSGEIWLSPGAEERAELKAFSQAVAAHSFWDVPGIDGRPPSPETVGIAEVLKRAAKKGPLCAGEVKVSYEGGGSMASMASRMGSQASLSYEKLSTDTLPAEAFIIPAGYSVMSY